MAATDFLSTLEMSAVTLLGTGGRVCIIFVSCLAGYQQSSPCQCQVCTASEEVSVLLMEEPYTLDRHGEKKISNFIYFVECFLSTVHSLPKRRVCIWKWPWLDVDLVNDRCFRKDLSKGNDH